MKRLLPFSLLLIIVSTSGLAAIEPALIPPVSVPQHNDGAIIAALSPDGRFLASGSFSGVVTFWDPGSGKLLRNCYRHDQPVTGLAFAPDGNTVLSAAKDHRLIVWEVATGKILASYMAGEAVLSLAMSPDGQLAALGRLDNTVVIWDLRAGKKVRSLDGHSGMVLALAFSPDGKLLLSGSADKTLRIWELDGGRSIHQFAGHVDAVSAVAFSIDGGRVFSASLDKTLKSWDSASARLLFSVAAHDKAVESLAISPDGSRLLTSSADRTLRLWDASSGAMIRSIPLGIRDLRLGWVRNQGSGPAMVSSDRRSAFFSPDGSLVASSVDGAIRFWDADTAKPALQLTGNTVQAVERNAMVLSPDQNFLFSARGASLVKWDLRTLAMTQVVYAGKYPIATLAMSPDGRRLLAGTSQETLVWDLSDPDKIDAPLIDPRKSASLAAISADNARVLVWQTGSEFQLRELVSGKILRRFTGHTAQITALAFCPDRLHAISASLDRTVKIWNLESGETEQTWTDLNFSVGSLDFSEDGQHVLMSEIRSEIRDISSGRIVESFGNSNTGMPSWAAAFVPKSSRLLIGFYGGQMHSIDREGKGDPELFSGHSGTIKALVVSRDGRTAFSDCADGTIRMWNLKTNASIVLVSDVSTQAKWLVYSDDGYWDGSGNCGDLMAMVRNLENWNIDQFAVRNNRPDILAGRMERSPELVTLFRAAWQKRLNKLGLSESGLALDYVAPSATILELTGDPALADGKGVRLRAVFRAKASPLARYQVYVNNVALFGVQGKPISGMESEVQVPVELTKGDNKVEVSCSDASGTESYRATRTISWQGSPLPNLYFLAFGVSEYADPAIPDLKYAAKDAEALGGLFGAMAGKGYGQVFSRVYVNSQVERKAIAEAKDFLRSARPDDTFVIFIAGHGIQIADATEAAEGGSTYFFLTADAILNDIAHTAAAFETIEDLLQGIAPRQKLFLMDTCESGEADTSSPKITLDAGGSGLNARTLNPAFSRGLSVVPAIVSQAVSQRDRWINNSLSRRSGAIVFSSCLANEAALEADAWQQGAFTYAILEAFRSKSADTNRDGWVSMDELRSYVGKEVPALVERITPGIRQHPTVDRDNIYIKFGFPLGK